MAAPPATNHFCGVRDTPIPSTDQVISVVVGDFIDSTVQAKPTLNKYYVPPGGVVVAWDTAGTGFKLSSRGAGRGRSVANKVYQVTSSHYTKTELNITTDKDMVTAINAGQFRVFGVAYDGISVANASLAKDPKNRNATGRFSSIFTGVATVSMPYKSGQTSMASMDMEKARIGDVVLVNPFAAPTFNFNGDPEDYVGYGLAIVKRQDWMKLVNGADAEIRTLFFDTFGINGVGNTVIAQPASDATSKQVRSVFGACCLGYVLDTGGAARNEVTVQLDLHTHSRHWGAGLNTAQTGDLQKFRADKTRWEKSYTDVNSETKRIRATLKGVDDAFLQTPEPQQTNQQQNGKYSDVEVGTYITAARNLTVAVTAALSELDDMTNDTGNGGKWTITDVNGPAPPTVNTGMIDVGAPMISTGGSLKRKRGAFAEVVETETAGMLGDDRAGDPCQSLLGLVGGAVASDSVGTVLYSTMNPGTAARVLAMAPATEVGLTPAGRGLPGTFAGEMLGAGGADPQSGRKIAARAEYLESLCSHSLPRSIDGIDPKAMSWGVSPTVETALKGTPDAVIQALATHSDNGHSIPSSKLVGAWVDATQYRPAAADDGASLEVYGDMPNAVQFQTIHLPEAMDVVRNSGKAVHNLPADSQQRILDAAAQCLRGNAQ